jgi:hypothetical protein
MFWMAGQELRRLMAEAGAYIRESDRDKPPRDVTLPNTPLARNLAPYAQFGA